MTNLDNLMWVRHNMPEECTLALSRFVRVNPSYNGANWEDCLDILLDSDSHLELTEPLWDEMDGDPLSSYVGVTLLWAYGGEPTAEEVRAVLS